MWLRIESESACLVSLLVKLNQVTRMLNGAGIDIIQTEQIRFDFLTGVNPMKLRVLIHAAEEGGFGAEIPALPGCVSEGETLKETLANIREAAEGWLEVADDRTPRSADTQLAEIEL